MLYMGILTWTAEKRNEVLARRLEKGMMLPAGIDLKGEWVDLCGGRDFVLFETDSPAALFFDAFNWSDIMDLVAIPVMDGEELLKVIKAGQ